MGANTSTLWATALTIYYSAAEYACPVWEISSPAKKSWHLPHDRQLQMHHWLPKTYKCWYVLAGIALPGILRSVGSRTERSRQAEDTRHPCHDHWLAPRCLKSRNSFLHAVHAATSCHNLLKRMHVEVPHQTSHRYIWSAAKLTWVNAWATLKWQIQPANAGPLSKPWNTCRDAYSLKTNAAWKIWWLLIT